MTEAPPGPVKGSPRRSAFTLVELLVVIGIIALLISVLLPTLGRAREAANAVACASNMRQLGQAFSMYTNQYDGYLPATEPNYTRYTFEWSRWPVFLVGPKLLNLGPNVASTYAILGPARVFKCPSDFSGDPDAPVDSVLGGTSYYANYRVLPWYSVNGGGTNGPQYRAFGAKAGLFKVTKYRNTSSRLVLTEKDMTAGGSAGAGGCLAVPGAATLYTAQGIVDSVKGRHGRGGKDGRANVLFLDWHVDSLSVKDIKAPAIRQLAGDTLPEPSLLWGQYAEN